MVPWLLMCSAPTVVHWVLLDPAAVMPWLLVCRESVAVPRLSPYPAAPEAQWLLYYLAVAPLVLLYPAAFVVPWLLVCSMPAVAHWVLLYPAAVTPW